MDELALHVEAYLFFCAEPVKKTVLSKELGTDEKTLADALSVLAGRLTHGIRLIETEREVALVTAPEAAVVIEHLLKEREGRDIGPAGLEVLAIVLYQGPSSKADIDHIRGVNSAVTLRSLMQRGLLERTNTTTGEGMYSGTPDVLAHLGVRSAAELPSHAELLHALASFKARTGEETASAR